MATAPGLAPMNIRQPGPSGPDMPDPAEVIVEVDDSGGEDQPEFDTKGNVLKIVHGDGAITVSLDGRPIEQAEKEDSAGWFENLAEKVDPMELTRISGDLLRGIEDDLTSRQEWIENRKMGLKLLGLKIELPGLGGGADGAPVEGMSKVRHPLLLEAVLRFQANARSELLPTDGPVKVRVDMSEDAFQTDELANAYEKDFNHYLTTTATEYYPDTDRMLLMLGFGGSAFKKVYFCPLRNRPVSESVDANDLIVSWDATDLANARRVTHRSMMKPSTVKRLQILGVYRDVVLTTPIQPRDDSVKEEERNIQGITASVSMNPDDRDREVYECYCELDLAGYEHKYKGKITGLTIPYRVTVDVSSREVLSIVRNFAEDDQELPVARKTFVKYTFVPGVGFYDIGLLHILGNTTNAITAAWRELLDAGMYANFPGFLVADTGGRQNSNMFRVPPGGGAQVKTGGMPIQQAIMPLPYQQPSQALMQLVQDMAQTGQRVGGTSEMQVGEGRADAPVGTTLAMIEQATKILNAVHKRMHAAQAEEFGLLAECFADHPETFWQRNSKPSCPWNSETFASAVHNCALVPQADPNTASHGQRVMKIMALKQLQGANPTMYDPIAVDTAALQAIGWNNPQQFLIPADKQNEPPPEVQKVVAEMAIKNKTADAKTKEADAKMLDAQANAQEVQMKAQTDSQQNAGLGQVQMMKTKADFMNAETKRMQVQNAIKRDDVNDQNRDQDRQMKDHLAIIGLAKDVLIHSDKLGVDQDQHSTEMGMRRAELAEQKLAQSAQNGSSGE